jgi:heat shock protein HslJ
VKHLYLLLISLVFMVSACTSIQPGGEALTIPSKWILVSFGKTRAEMPVIENSAITLEFADNNQVGGSGGCNSYGAKVEVQGKTLTITEIVSTLMACVDDKVMEQETQYFTALQGASNFEISGDNLTIFYEDGQSQLNFVKQ